MLTRLLVRDLVVIPSLEIEFGPGLTVITGESGAGKSVLLAALELALGARASVDRIRQGAARAEAAAEFSVAKGSECARYLAERKLADPDDPGRCVTRRTLDRGGRSHAFVNDTPVTRATLAGLGETLLDVHAQGENTRLLRRDVQLALLDDYGVPLRDRQQLADLWKNGRRVRGELEALDRSSGGGDAAALLDYQLQELDELNPRPGEYEAIDAEHVRLSQVDALREIAAHAAAALENIDPLRRAAGEIGRLEGNDPAIVSAQENTDSALTLIDGALADLRRYADSLEPDPERLAAMDTRLARLHDIARKHQVEPGQLPELHAEISSRAEARTAHASQRLELEERAQRLEAAYREAALRIRTTRQASAGLFGERVGQVMQTLGIENGSLAVIFSGARNDRGLDAVEFQVTTGGREQSPAPLARVASGGEQARIALAITVVAAEKSTLPCLVMDEADIGVGGVTADTVGRMLRKLADRAQVICATHAPQVAALGDWHLSVSRRQGESGVAVGPLSLGERVEEIARMLSGARVTERARENARELLSGSQG